MYAKRHAIAIELADSLGFGQDGYVFPSNRGTAVKAFVRLGNYQNERDAYRRLAEQKVTAIGPFNVPSVVCVDDDLMIVEMFVVAPPYLLDFGKAYVDRTPPYPAETIAETMDEAKRLFDEQDWPLVEQAVLELKLIGIHYLDIKPANVCARLEK